MAVGTKLLYARRGNAQSISNSVVVPATSRRVMVLPRGGQVDGNQSGVSMATVHKGHGFVVGQKIMIGTDESTARTLSVVASNGSSITWTGGTLELSDGDVIVNLGNDTLTGGTPDYDGTTVEVYTSLDSVTAESPSDVVTDSTTGEYEYWTTATQVWELLLTAGAAADLVIRDAPLKAVEDVLLLNPIAAANFITLSQDAEAIMYIKDNNLVIKFNDGGTDRYKYLALDGTGTTWAQSTGEPS